MVFFNQRTVSFNKDWYLILKIEILHFIMHPKFKRQLKQALTFALIWMFFGILYTLLEYGIMGEETFYPSTKNKYEFKSSLLYVAIGSFLMGFIQGMVEAVWFKNLFKDETILKKILIKGIYYALILIIFLSITTLIVNAKYYGRHPFDTIVLESFWRFISVFSFWSIIIYTFVILTISLFYSEITNYVGFGVLSNFFLNKYHKPIQEVRVFMFLDMRSSTSIAEHMGHKKYFDLLKKYYSDMTNAILETSGQIYQYVGDEIVVSWPGDVGVSNNNCILCLRKIDADIGRNSDFYEKEFGLVPEFKAGYHIGEVTAGEIGIVKKDIIYTGDVLNTTARIQSECNNHQSKILISETLLKKLTYEVQYKVKKIGNLKLRGKSKSMNLFSLELK